MRRMQGVEGGYLKFAIFTKDAKPTVDEAIDYLEKKGEVTVYKGNRGDKFPEGVETLSQDILISYLSPWIIPSDVLRNTRLWNINFHPGPPEYPGIGCYNFALYNCENIYGVTAHLMEKKVDTGKIIGVKRFQLLHDDDALNISLKSYDAMLSLFYEVVDNILKLNRLPICDETWKRKPYTRQELEELCRIDPTMSEQEVKRRIRATTYPEMPGTYIKIHGYKFVYNSEML